MKNLIQAAVVTLFAASTAQAQQAVQWRVQDGGNGHWYQALSTPTGISWEAARDEAFGLGGCLACLETPGEESFCFAKFARESVPDVWTFQGGLFIFGPWIGGYQLAGSAEPSLGWHWLSGVSFDPTRFPSCCNDACGGSLNEDRLHLYYSASGQTSWNDLPSVVTCGNQVRGFIIEWSADCNSDGIIDYGQILDGTLTDVNADGIPDVCQAPCVPADLNNDRSVDGADLGVLLSAWGPAGPEPTRADINGNGIVDGADLGVLLANWGACGEAPPWATVVQWQPDPAVVTDDQLRSAIAATGLPWRVRDAGTQIEMLLVPPGTFQMGCIMGSIHGPCTTQELPVHQVTLTNAFYFGRYEVTQAQ
jgi:hypothetical protein